MVDWAIPVQETVLQIKLLTCKCIWTRVCPRFFDLVGHETMYASSGNKHFFSISWHCQTYQNYDQSLKKLGTILGDKVS